MEDSLLLLRFVAAHYGFVILFEPDQLHHRIPAHPTRSLRFSMGRSSRICQPGPGDNRASHIAPGSAQIALSISYAVGSPRLPS